MILIPFDIIKLIVASIDEPASYVRATMSCKTLYEQRFTLLGSVRSTTKRDSDGKVEYCYDVLSNGWKHGECIAKDADDGFILRRGSFIFNQLDGEVTRYFAPFDDDDTIIEETTEYKMGKKHIELTVDEVEDGHTTMRYYNNGKLHKIEDYDSEDDLVCLIEYDDKKRKILAEDYNNESGIHVKRTITYDDETIYIHVIEYLMDYVIGDYNIVNRGMDDELEGPAIYNVDYDGSRVTVRVNFVNNKKEGLATVEMTNMYKSIFASLNFHKDGFDGTIKTYHGTRLIFEGKYRNSKLDVVSMSQHTKIPDLPLIFDYEFPGIYTDNTSSNIEPDNKDAYDLSKLM
jgi:hypothetical protein